MAVIFCALALCKNHNKSIVIIKLFLHNYLEVALDDDEYLFVIKEITSN